MGAAREDARTRDRLLRDRGRRRARDAARARRAVGRSFPVVAAVVRAAGGGIHDVHAVSVVGIRLRRRGGRCADRRCPRRGARAPPALRAGGGWKRAGRPWLLRCVASHDLRGAVVLLDEFADVFRGPDRDLDGRARDAVVCSASSRVESAGGARPRFSLRVLDSRRARLRLRKLAMAPSPAAVGLGARIRRIHGPDVPRRRLARPVLADVERAPRDFACAAGQLTLQSREGGRMNRRDFARLLAISGAAPFVTPDVAWARGAAAPKLPPTPASPDEKFWIAVRDQFVMPKDLTMLNAANLCPSSAPVLETLYNTTKDMDQDPSSDNRAKLGDGRENTRKALAEFLRVTPEEIVITRNTSESNDLVSNGVAPH